MVPALPLPHAGSHTAPPSSSYCSSLRRSRKLPDAWAFLQAPPRAGRNDSSSSGGDLFIHTGSAAGRAAASRHRIAALVPRSAKAAAPHGERRWQCCAVVGNAGGLLRQRYGAEIDAHEVVFRMNQAPLRPYARHVGTKATFRILNKLWAAGYGSAHAVRRLHLPLEKNVSLILSRSSGPELPKVMRSVRSALHSLQRHADVSVRVLAPGPVSIARRALAAFRSCNRQAGRHHSGGQVPSSGIVTIVGLLPRCRSVSVYGIGDPWTAGVPYQYYRLANTHRARGNPTHSFGNERDFLVALAARNHLRMCTLRGCRGRPLQC